MNISQSNIVLCGSVAVGKSTILTALLKHMSETHDVQLYPEFIHDDPIAHEILKLRFNNKISALTFQNFILDKWEQMKTLKPSEINIYERLPDDAVEVFARMSLNDLEYSTQVERLKSFHFPKYSDMNSKNTIWIKYNNRFERSPEELTELIETLIKHYQFIVVEVISEMSYENYIKRGRDGEVYTREQLNALRTNYNQYTAKKISEIQCEVLDV